MSKEIFALKGKRVWVLGHRGMVGAALCRRLAAEECEILTADRSELDLKRQADVEAWVAKQKPDAAFMAAATVGGILANDSRPAEFIYDNLIIEANVTHSLYLAGGAKLLFLGSSCIYPKFAPQPMREDALLTGELEPTNQWYAVAKISGIKLCQAYRRQYGCDFISALPTNIYGPGDNFDLQSSHVAPALMAKAHTAKQAGAAEMEVWGSGKVKRELMHVDDLADGLVHLMKTYSDEDPVNIGTGQDVTIKELAEVVAMAVGFEGGLAFDTSKPDGTPRKLLDVTKLADLGWQAKIGLAEGFADTYGWYLDNQTD